MDDKVKIPCKHRYNGTCQHRNSQWYGNKVVGKGREHKCKNCKLYE